jgi:diguanylate cyclase (GGDEF)-like protein
MMIRFPQARRDTFSRTPGIPPAQLVLGVLGAFASGGLAALGYLAARPILLVAAAALAPFVAVVLYRLYTRPAVEAMRLALTDPLTGLGNTRHFLERLERDIDLTESEDVPFSLCVVDVDDFKRVNDRYGHLAGNGVLVEIASCLRHGGESFRLGGDEFALLLPGCNQSMALEIAESVLGRIASTQYPHGGSVTASAGLATYPSADVDRGGLMRAADRALYHAKSMGKDCARGSWTVPDDPEPATVDGDQGNGESLGAAYTLARAVAARGGGLRAPAASSVGDVAARIAMRLDLPVEHVELVRLAGILSDVGKLALPDDVLRKPGPLTEHERLAVQRHPEIGSAMLASLGADPVATWIRHHHERWDGRGYPERLAGEQIPLAARILFVADAFEAMTSEQAWRPKLTPTEALAELERCAGTQFDPGVVSALAAELEAAEPVPAGAAA